MFYPKFFVQNQMKVSTLSEAETQFGMAKWVIWYRSSQFRASLILKYVLSIVKLYSEKNDT